MDHPFPPLHGVSRHDPYYWLRDDNRKDQQVLDYLSAENAHTAAVAAPLTEFVDSVYKEMRARIKEDDASVPLR